ncbi:porin [Janthinobacterium agaricidamnosum]|uniref:Gram-negative porin family protein n=1 Tax=Janthinobacterium agaricidamnosum NBRC 102515 = DSM 9628 TaxID=1349767 RepID=W0V9Z6_9BURK|nr:porin [Janthinobacterium agaricidamnosum]CDG85639.1 gram-negative porin family protein [Janthinobacterium agaricidamnosum NBRC 102515 = DSM 9628]
MKKSLLALALFSAFAGMAHAQSSVQIYGTVDAGIAKATGNTTIVTKRDNNKLGFKGVEDLGSGLKALFQLEIRYESDTGTIENTSGVNSRPLFQGQSRVGLQGDFGTVRLGRGLTAYQETSTAFEPWSGMPTPAGFQTDLQVAGYTSDPLSAPGNSRNRFSNAVFYNTPVLSGFQLNVTIASKEGNNGALVGTGTPATPQYPLNATASVNPYSLSGTYTNGPFAGMLAYERNAVESKLWSIGATLVAVPDLKLFATYQRQDEGHTRPVNPKTKAWVLGLNYDVGPGKVRAGYGQKTPDGVVKTKQASLGYDYNLSKRTYLYADISNRKDATSRTYYGVGVHHNF